MQKLSSTILVQYTAQGDKVGEQEAAIREWVGSIKALNDPEVRYSVYKAEDGVSFIHHIQLASSEAGSRLSALPLFGPFGEGTRARSENGLKVTKLSLVTSSVEE